MNQELHAASHHCYANTYERPQRSTDFAKILNETKLEPLHKETVQTRRHINLEQHPHLRPAKRKGKSEFKNCLLMCGAVDLRCDVMRRA